MTPDHFADGMTVAQVVTGVAILLFLFVIWCRYQVKQAERAAREEDAKTHRIFLVAYDFMRAAEWCHVNRRNPRDPMIVIVTKDEHIRCPDLQDRIVDLGGPAILFAKLRTLQMYGMPEPVRQRRTSGIKSERRRSR